ncbi:hypothetical protein ANN_22489 [Periplaneta americana]|uniref:DUF4817 domain-containing protein n=1 Tax=Periplaneta americana TaxID=6978 RepID=A0ABQ8S8L4_PERAM|nr:hypothetical protein ANN_22489 [Periplaneta americana]
MIDMILIYGEVRKNSAAAACIYAERFPARRHPAPKTFVAVERRLETGRFVPVVNKAGRPQSRRTAAAAEEENILRSKEDLLFLLRWIGRAGPGAWPARSPDFAPNDLLWERIKDIFYQVRPTTKEDMKQRIREACGSLSCAEVQSRMLGGDQNMV